LTGIRTVPVVGFSDRLARTPAFLLLKDSRSSFGIEGKDPPQDRIQRQVIAKSEGARFDEGCLAVPAAFDPDAIKALREKNHVSQPVFARYLNTSESTVQKWETGAKRPSGLALKLLSVVQKHGSRVLS
jgi:putative transcriptional regulator